MRIGSVAVAFKEPRFIGPHLKHHEVDEQLVLNSSVPWQGTGEDNLTAEAIGKAQSDAFVIRGDWPTEHEQRNVGQEFYSEFDWIWILDPDEFLTKADQLKLKEFLKDAPLDAYTCERQLTYWKSGYVIDPAEDYKQIIAVRPGVRFFDKRCVDTQYGHAPVTLHHFSWARTDREVKDKITHYAHANEIDPEWYERVWKQWTPQMQNLHPLTPEALKQAVPAKLPKELEGLNLWPQ